jgi:hypothetical protein
MMAAPEDGENQVNYTWGSPEGKQHNLWEPIQQRLISKNFKIYMGTNVSDHQPGNVCIDVSLKALKIKEEKISWMSWKLMCTYQRTLLIEFQDYYKTGENICKSFVWLSSNIQEYKQFLHPSSKKINIFKWTKQLSRISQRKIQEWPISTWIG